MSKINAQTLRDDIANLVAKHHELTVKNEIFEPGVSPVAVSGKLIDEREKNKIVEAALDGWLTTGRFNNEFEKKLAGYIGVKHLITVNSGSSANLVAFHSLTSTRLGDRAIRVGDEVISVAASFPTTINPIIQFGAVPVFLDIEIPTYNIDVDKLESAITPKTKAIMLAHTLGNPFNLDVVTAVCRKHNLWLIEDCCDALGSKYSNQNVGTFGDIGTLSFYPAHHITMGEGGAVFTNSLRLKKIAESFRDWGRDCYCAPGRDNTCGRRFQWKLGDLPLGYDHKYIYSHMGFNLKITDMQAACGLAQLEKLESFVALRKKNYAFLRESLADLEASLILPEATASSEPSWFGFPLTLRESDSARRRELLMFLNERVIGTRLLFAGNIIKQPYMSGKHFRIVGEMKNTDKIMNDTFWVGVHPGLTDEMLDYIGSSLFEFFSKDKKNR